MIQNADVLFFTGGMPEKAIAWMEKLGITDVVIEEPLLSSNNSYTVGTLLRFNGMICDSVYRVLGIVPHFISSYDARTYSFPELLSVRKFNRKGGELTLHQIKKLIKDSHVVLFGSYPYDVDKKIIMMNKINELYHSTQSHQERQYLSSHNLVLRGLYL